MGSQLVMTPQALVHLIHCCCLSIINELTSRANSKSCECWHAATPRMSIESIKNEGLFLMKRATSDKWARKNLQQKSGYRYWHSFFLVNPAVSLRIAMISFWWSLEVRIMFSWSPSPPRLHALRTSRSLMPLGFQWRC